MTKPTWSRSQQTDPTPCVQAVLATLLPRRLDLGLRRAGSLAPGWWGCGLALESRHLTVKL